MKTRVYADIIQRNTGVSAMPS